MKYIFYALITACALFSCKSKQTSTVKDSTATETTTGIDNELIKKFKPIVNGVWVNKEYLAKLAETKSPAAANWHDYVVIDIETKKMVGDSLLIESVDTHDGGMGELYFRKGKRPNTLKFYDYDFGYSIKDGDTTLLLYTDKKHGGKIYRFTRAPYNKQAKDFQDRVGFMVNRILVEGVYNYNDSTAEVHEVKFDQSGNVFGFQNFKKYEINIDIGSDVMNNLDEIIFNRDMAGRTSFNYKIIGDTLAFYDSHPNADSTELILGKRLYKLVRQHKPLKNR